MDKKDMPSEETRKEITGSQSSNLIPRDKALLDIFSDRDLHCHNLLEMDNPLAHCFDALKDCIVTSNSGKTHAVTPDTVLALIAYLKGGSPATKDMLIADMDVISAEIKQKIKEGVYHIADSKQFEGDLRAAIVDAKGKIVKQITLKNVPGTPRTYGDLNTLALQAALKQITQQLQCIDAGIQYMISLHRRGDFQTPYLDAVQKILDAKEAPIDRERDGYIKEAITSLEHGLNGLYGDLKDCVQKLRGIKLPIITQRTISYIGEDMVFIPQYVGLLAYLFNYLGMEKRAKDIVKFYQTELYNFVSTPLPGDRLPPAQLVHKYCKYSENNLDFWYTGIKRIQSEMASIPVLPMNSQREVYVIQEGDAENGWID